MLISYYFFFPIVKTASAEELGSFEQAHKWWLFLHVHAFSCSWYCGPGCCDIFAYQILVITLNCKFIANKEFLFVVVCLGVERMFLVVILYSALSSLGVLSVNF